MKMKAVISILLILVLLAAGVFVSFQKFSTLNPLASLYGLVKISVTDSQYAVIQSQPWYVMIAKPENSQYLLDDYMAKRGYAPIDRMGSHITYGNGTDTEMVHFNVHRYYSVWEWN